MMLPGVKQSNQDVFRLSLREKLFSQARIQISLEGKLSSPRIHIQFRGDVIQSSLDEGQLVEM